MIRLENVSKKYGNFAAVSNLDLEVRPGELFGFLGPNGAGKTTTIKMITGLLKPSAGKVFIAGHDLEREPLAAKRVIGYIPDRSFLYDKLTGREFLHFMGGLYRMADGHCHDRAGELLELFELDPWQNELIESYSHGMKQKLIMAAALLHRPRLIVVDEPMVGLDPKSARMVRAIYREWVAQGGTVFMSTHTMEIAETMCDRIGIVNEGKLIACGTMAELRRGAGADQTGRLESIFLKLTGGEQIREFVQVLQSPFSKEE